MKQLRHINARKYYTEVSVTYDGRIPSTVTPSEQGAVISAEVLDWADDNGPRGFGGTPVDHGAWPEPPHVALANWRFDSVERVVAFTRRYGPVWLNADELVVKKTDIENMQRVLQQAWGGPLNPEFNAYEYIEKSAEILRVPFGARKIGVTIVNLWLYICALFLIDRRDSRLRICSNANCVSPYFISARRDQTHCSIECRNIVNVRRWRSKPANQKREREARRANRNNKSVRRSAR